MKLRALHEVEVLVPLLDTLTSRFARQLLSRLERPVSSAVLWAVHFLVPFEPGPLNAVVSFLDQAIASFLSNIRESDAREDE